MSASGARVPGQAVLLTNLQASLSSEESRGRALDRGKLFKFPRGDELQCTCPRTWDTRALQMTKLIPTGTPHT
uniref:Serine protease 12 n=1 Tax=Molossus molossus TaxID=27622 RepID=A0A7J8IAQ8_MOLMO|nr:serine protease 12 [Molossus molossus]